MPSWTKEQESAIYECGKNIIVSAGAGSGKTAVLSERVLEKVMHGTDVDRLLILTFTKAAAAEMKERIRKKIKKNNLVEQLNKLDNSYITTFDSYSLSIVKKYHYLLNVKKNVNIIENNVLNIKTQEYLDEVMEEKYLRKDDNFCKLINDFCIKDDDDIKASILNLNNKLNMKYDKKEYLNSYLEKYYSDEYIMDKVKQYEELLKSKVKLFDITLYKLGDMVDTDYFTKLMDMCNNLINSDNYLDIKTGVDNITRLPNLPRGSDEFTKKTKDDLKGVLDEIKSLTSFQNIDEIKNNILMTKPYVEAIIDIISKLDEKIDTYKHENDLYDFVDISKMAIKVVMENKNIRDEIKNYFLEILVDEYQDTSDLQEVFISLICNDDLYMVGDVKQSIYRFRNANPNIFREKYNNYEKNNGGMKIDLLKNFRSREEVLNNINLIFDYIMSDSIGGADYIKSHRMNFGNITYNEEGKTSQNNDFEIYNYLYDKELGFDKDEIEAFIIADDINKKISSHYRVFDKDNKILRDITYNDFSILIDRSTTFELYKKIFLYKQIPLSIYKDEYLTNSNLFLVIKNIFRLIDLLSNNGNKKEIEYCFLSIGRSFLCSLDDNYLFDVIRNNSYEETDIFKIIHDIATNVSGKTISMILDEIINKFDVYNKLRKISSLNENLVKIEYLYTLSETLNSMGYDYTHFVDFLNKIFDSGTNITFPLNKEDGNSVKIMTIHKSKGLEYHICYFPGLTKKFNDSDLKERIIFDNELGIITPFFDEGIGSTIYRELFKKKYMQEEISEKIRLFYVALTRAKEKMIFIVPLKDKDEIYNNDGLVDSSVREGYRCFSDILESIKSKLNTYIKEIDINSLNLSKDYNLINGSNLFDNINKINNKITITKYPKYEMIEKEESHFSKSSFKIFTKEEKNKMEFGTEIHYYLETIDLQNPDLSDVKSPFKEKIEEFLKCDLLKNIDKAKVYQEYEFIEKTDDEEKHGIIDLMLEYSTYIDIIDYKLKNIDDEAYIKQLTGYKKYIESISNKEVNIYLYSIIDSKYLKM